MRNTKVEAVVRGWAKFRTSYKNHKWVRVATGTFVGMVIFSAGIDTGHKEMDPRQTGGPGSTVTEVQLQGRWDGVLTDAEGNAFCLVGWPCEDAGLDK